jgi:hypothetical protein
MSDFGDVDGDVDMLSSDAGSDASHDFSTRPKKKQRKAQTSSKKKKKRKKKKKGNTKPKPAPLQSLQEDARTKALFDQQDKTLFLPLAFFEQQSKNVRQGNESQGAESTSLTTDQQNQQKVIQGLANSVIRQDLKDILGSSSKRDYLEKTKVLSCHLSLDRITEVTMEGYEKEIYRFIHWIGLNREALMEMMCGTWSGLLRDIQPLHLQLYVLVRAGLDLNVEHRTGQHVVPLAKHPAVEKRYTGFINVADALRRYKLNTSTLQQIGTLIDSGTLQFKDIDILEDYHGQICKLLSSISTITENVESGSSTIASLPPGPSQQDAALIAKGISLLNTLSVSCETKLQAQLEDVAFASIFATCETTSNDATSNDATSNDHSTIRAGLFKTVRDAYEQAKALGLEEGIKTNQVNIQQNITSAENDLKQWLKDVLDAFGQQESPSSQGMDAHLRNIRVFLSDRFLAKECEGREWEHPPNRKAEKGAPIFGLKSLKKVHSALLILLKQNATFFADPDLKAKANTLRILKQHMKLSEANGRGPTQRTVLDQGRMDAYMAHLKDKFDCQHTKVKKALRALSKVSKAPGNSSKQALDSKYMEELSMLMILSSRITLLHKGAHCGERFGQSKKAELKVTQGPNQERIAQSFSKATDTKTSTEDMLLTIPHHKDCRHKACPQTCTASKYGLPTFLSTTCTSCVLVRHVMLHEFINKEFMARSFPTTGLHPARKNNSKSIGGKTVNVNKLEQVTVSRHQRGVTQSVDGEETFISCTGAINAQHLVKEEGGHAIVNRVPLAGPLNTLRPGDKIGAVRKGSSNTLTETQKQNLGKEGTIEDFSTVEEALRTGVDDGSHIYLYALRAQKQRRDIDGATFCKWLKTTIREWQHSFKDNTTANPLFMSEKDINNIGTHSPRVSLAANAYDLGCDIIGIMKALDHKSMTMTVNYVKQALKSRAAKANTIQSMTSGQRVDTGTAAPRRIEATGRNKCPSGVSAITWEKLQMDCKRYRNQGYLKFQCTHCCAPYDDRRHSGFSGNQALQNHVTSCQKKKKKKKKKTTAQAKVSRQKLIDAGINFEDLLGEVAIAKTNCAAQVQLRAQKKNNRMKNKKRKER